jgi:hypothetical protein
MYDVKFYKEDGKTKQCTTKEFYEKVRIIKDTAEKVYDNWKDKDSLEITEIFLKFEPKRIIRYTIITDLENGIISQLYIDTVMNLED